VPGRTSKIIFKNQDGTEMDLSALKKGRLGPQPSSSGIDGFNINNGSANRKSIRMERKDAKKKREEIAKKEKKPAKKEAEEQAKRDVEEKAKRMSEDDAKKRIDGDSKEFFAVRDLEEAEVYFTRLTDQHHFRLVDKLVTFAIESREVDAQLVGDFFSRAASKGLCSQVSFEQGFMPTAEILDDIAIDAPKAFNLMAIMVKGANLDKERQRCIVAKSVDSDKLAALLS